VPLTRDFLVQPVRPVHPVGAVPERFVSKSVSTQRHLSPPRQRSPAIKETGTFGPFARTLAEWEHTAEVWANPDLSKRLTSEIPGDGKAVPRPKARR